MSTTGSIHSLYFSVQFKDGAESLTILLQHSIDSSEFTERGVASVRSLKSSTTTMTLSQNLLSHVQLEQLKVSCNSHTHTGDLRTVYTHRMSFIVNFYFVCVCVCVVCCCVGRCVQTEGY